MSHQCRTQKKPMDAWLSACLLSVQVALLASVPQILTPPLFFLNFSKSIWTSRQSDLDDFSPYILLWNFSKPGVNSKDVTVTANISTTWIPPLTSHWTCFSRHPAKVLRILTSLLEDISLWPLALCSSWFLPGAIPAGLGSLGLTYRTALNSKTLLLPLISPTEFFQKVYIVCNAINSL